MTIWQIHRPDDIEIPSFLVNLIPVEISFLVQILYYALVAVVDPKNYQVSSTPEPNFKRVILQIETWYIVALNLYKGRI